MAGRLLKYRYDLAARLCDGGALQSWKGHDRFRDGASVVVKLLNSPHLVDEKCARAWVKRLSEQRSLLLPGAPAVIEVARESDGLLLVRDFVEGQPLEKWLVKPRPFDDALRLGILLLRAVAAWHSNGVAHGALHPGNIILTGASPVFTDWDQAAAALEVFGVSIQRPDAGAYLAPEVRAGRRAQAGSDVYTVGVILWEALTGRKLVPDAPRPRPSEVNPGLPAGVDLVVEGMLRPQPENRYPAAQAAEALAKLRELGEPQQRRSPRELRRQRARDRADQPHAPLPWPLTAALTCYRALFVLLGTLIISGVTLAAMGWGTYRWLDESRPTEVIVPDVTGWPKDKAKAFFEGTLGLELMPPLEQASKTVPAGSVIFTQPGPGRKVRAGRKVHVVISTGPAQLVMPRLVTQTFSDAQAEVMRLGLKMGNEQQQNDDTIPAGYVIKQEPEAGRRVDSGAQVNLWVSLGPENPDGRRRNRTDDQDEKAKQSEKPKRQGTVRVTVPAEYKICWVKIVLHDDNGESVVYNQLKNAGDAVKQDVKGVGATSIEVFLNDHLVQKKDL